MRLSVLIYTFYLFSPFFWHGIKNVPSNLLVAFMGLPLSWFCLVLQILMHYLCSVNFCFPFCYLCNGKFEESELGLPILKGGIHGQSTANFSFYDCSFSLSFLPLCMGFTTFIGGKMWLHGLTNMLLVIHFEINVHKKINACLSFLLTTNFFFIHTLDHGIGPYFLLQGCWKAELWL